jgi:transcriptional pleiotropic regulator of transition state genes
MKATGVIRHVDELGRVVIPIELRRSLDIRLKDPIEFFVEDSRIILQKHVASNTCFITGETSEDNLSFANGKLVLSKEGAQSLLKEIEDRFHE